MPQLLDLLTAYRYGGPFPSFSALSALGAHCPALQQRLHDYQHRGGYPTYAELQAIASPS